MKDSLQPIVKAVLIGESGVGKTSLISRFVHQTFSQKEPSTTGVSYSQKILKYANLNNSELWLDIWDTAGQEKFRNLNKIFYKDAKMVIIVFDLTLQSTFNEARDFWAKEIKENGLEDAVIGIAGNKSDDLKNIVVDDDEVNELASKLNAIYRRTSAKNDDGTINDFFHLLGERIIVNEGKMEELKRKNTITLMRNSELKSKKIVCC